MPKPFIMWGSVSHTQIGDRLGISRQQVGRYVRQGMPTTNLDAAVGWYESNTQYSRRKRRSSSGRVPAYVVDDQPLEAMLEEIERRPAPMRLDFYPFGFWQSDPVRQIACAIAEAHDDPERKLDDPDDAVAFVRAVMHGVLAAIRCHILLMPAIVAEHANALDPEAAERALDEWAKLFIAHWSDDDPLVLYPGAKSLEEWFAHYRVIYPQRRGKKG